MISERRLHPVAAVAHALGALRELAVPIVIGMVAGRGGEDLRSLVIGLLGAAASAVIGLVRWRATTYRVDGGALHFRSGVFSPDETVVPVARIQSVDSIAGPLQRLFGITGLQVQVPGGGGKAEVDLSSLSRPAMHELRAALGHPEADVAGVVAYRLGLGAVLLAGLTGPRIGVLAPVSGLIGLAAQEGFVGIDTGLELFHRLDDPAHAVLAAAAVLGAAWALSVVGAVIAYAGFEVARVGERLRIRRGLLRRQAVTVPVNRIDGVVVVESLLRRLARRAALRLEVASLGHEEAAERTLFPLVRARDAEALIARVLPELAVPLTPELRPPRRALRRYVTVPALLAVVVGAGVTIAVPSLWPLAVALPLAMVAFAIDNHAVSGVRLGDHHVVVRRGGTGERVTLAARIHRLQDYGTAVNPLQRRARLAHVGLHVGSGTGMRARHLERDAADAFLSRLRSGSP